MACDDCRRPANTKMVYAPGKEWIGPAGNEKMRLCYNCRKKRKWQARKGERQCRAG